MAPAQALPATVPTDTSACRCVRRSAMKPPIKVPIAPAIPKPAPAKPTSATETMVSDQVGREKITIPVSDTSCHRAPQGNPPARSESPQHGQGFCNGYGPVSLRHIPAPAPRLTNQQQHHSGKQHAGNADNKKSGSPAKGFGYVTTPGKPEQYAQINASGVKGQHTPCAGGK